MKIGLDLSSLQGPHRMRGIGYTLINFINNIPIELKGKHCFVFYYYTDKHFENPFDLLDLQGFDYEVRSLQHIKPVIQPIRLPGKFNALPRIATHFFTSLKHNKADSRITDTEDIDVFLQTDQMIPLPGGRKLKKVFIAYDLIPYVLEWDYLWSYRTARLNRLPVQAAIRCAGRRWLYLYKLRSTIKRADKVLAISDTTRQDFITHIPSSRKKIVTTPLGVNAPKLTKDKMPSMSNYVDSSWGYLRKPYTFDPSTPFLLFVGGADRRRKLDELVIAFNHLRGQGHNLKLVFAGDSMKGPKNISTESIQKALIKSSYLEDIIFMGFVNDTQRDWLYKNALAFVFPSKYEGFGLPVLEAFSYGTPVISYPNEATIEVAGDAAVYVNDPQGLIAAVCQLLKVGKKDRGNKERKAQAKKFSWKNTSNKIINELESMV
jgi:glycosyltransferase involved in cell wall biosynthesis